MSETRSDYKRSVYIFTALELDQTRQRNSQNAHSDPHTIVTDDVNLVMYNKYTDPTNTETTVIGHVNHVFNVVSTFFLI